MKKRLIILPLVMISLLTSCRQNKMIRSDIKQFIASFSLSDARATYLDAGYTSTLISHDADGKITKIIEKISFNIKDLENIAFDHDYKHYEDDVLKEGESFHRYVYKDDGKYYYNNNGSVAEIAQNTIINTHVTKFFYQIDLEGIHSRGMYIADTIYTYIYDMQDYVTIDFEAKTFTYDMPWGVKKDAEGFDFEEVLVVDELGVVKSCELTASNGITTIEKSILVYNNV